jgi:hypothetical protein
MRVLLATDGSADSRRATRWLRHAPWPSDTTVCVLTVATLKAPPRESQSVAALREKVQGTGPPDGRQGCDDARAPSSGS